MSHIYIYSPAGAVRDKAGFKRGVKRLEAMGHEVEIDADALTSYLRFAGDDAARLQAIARAAASGADLTLISRGGYGLTRMLPALATTMASKAIARSVERGTRWMGYSDFTAFQSALFAQRQLVTWTGSSLVADFGMVAAPDDIMQACFEDVLIGQNEGAGWTLPKADRETFAGLSIKATALWGGNLTVLTGLIGTPYLPQIDKGILFFEDTGESPYRIERRLTQWLHAGILAGQKAIVLGQFTESPLYPHDRGFKMTTVVQWLRSQLKIPVLTGLPFGHVPTKVMLPFGAPARLLCDGHDAVLLWEGV